MKREKRVAQGLPANPPKKKRLAQEESGIRVAIDCSFESYMNEKASSPVHEIRSTSAQLGFCYSANRNHAKRLSLTATSLTPSFDQVMSSRITNYSSWSSLKFTDAHFTKAFNPSECIYLTADSPNIIHTLDPAKVYIVGGIVDRNRHKGLCFEQAKTHGVDHGRLPIDGYIKMASRKVLTVNHEILINYVNTSDWESAFLNVLPQRKGASSNRGGGDVSAAAEPAPVIDEYSLADPVNVLDKLPKGFYTELGSPKWQERKEALTTLLTIASTPKIEDARYGELVNVLSKKVADANVVVAVLAIQCIQCLAKGLRSAFNPYRNIVISPLMERLKEKKTNVLEATRAALDSVALSVNSTMDLLEDIIGGINHKNPLVKTESIQWLSRCMSNVKKAKKDFNRNNSKQILETLVKAADDGTDTVRDAAQETIGKFMIILTEQAVLMYIERLDKVKQARAHPLSVQSAFEKENTFPGSMPRKSPLPAPSGPTKKKALGGSGSGSASGSQVSLTKSNPVDEPIKFMFTDDSVDDVVASWIPDNVRADIADSNWKNRLAAMQSIIELLGDQPPPIPSEAIVRYLSKKPGWKETNFQVATNMLNVFRTLASDASFTKATASLLIPGCLDKLSDMKVKKIAGECLSACAEKISFEFVLSQMYEPSKKLKSPKAIADVLGWINDNLIDFATAGVNVKALVEFTKLQLGNANAAVRTAAMTVLITIYRCVGSDLLGSTKVSASSNSPLDTFAASAQAPSTNQLLSEHERLDLMVDVMLTHATSLDVVQSIDGLKQLERLLTSSPEIAGLHINEIVSAATLQLRIAFTTLDIREPSMPRLVRHISTLLTQILSNPTFSKTVSVYNLEQCANEILTRLVDQSLAALDPSNTLGRSLNVLMVRIIETCDSNVSFRVLLSILQRSAASCSNVMGDALAQQIKHADLVMNFWKKRLVDKVVPQGDMPLRTVKTILHELVNALGKDLLQYMDIVALIT
eukprot:jgi/Hompol1/1759/HPOL_000015-RA